VEGSVFSAIGVRVVGAPLEITHVRTETALDAKIGTPSLPYHLAGFIRAGLPGADLTAGLRYVNRLGGGFYEVEAALRWDPVRPPERQVSTQVWFAYVLPVR
jgi:hypothetical protein